MTLPDTIDLRKFEGHTQHWSVNEWRDPEIGCQMFGLKLESDYGDAGYVYTVTFGQGHVSQTDAQLAAAAPDLLSLCISLKEALEKMRPHLRDAASELANFPCCSTQKALGDVAAADKIARQAIEGKQ